MRKGLSKGESASDVEDMRQALKFSMPPNTPRGVTFAAVLEAEYRALLQAGDRAKLLGACLSSPPTHMAPNDPRAPYRRRPFDVRPNAHIGQLKLLWAEVPFLLEWGDMADTLVYAGAADGSHILLLKQLFPHLKFELYDPCAFNRKLFGVPGINIHTGSAGLFTTEIARNYNRSRTNQKAGVLFISDIRTGDTASSTEAFEACVSRDMKAQREWMREMRPIAGMFKFRLPYKPGKTEWLAPHSALHLRYGIFATKSATELRLISTDPDRLQMYDNTDVEEKAYYFNNFTRACQYSLCIPGRALSSQRMALGIDDCWDCCAMRDVCAAFLAKQQGQPGNCALVEDVAAIVAWLAVLPEKAALLCAQYACVVSDADLYSLIARALENCGKHALEKLKISPHGARKPGVQWADCMRSFDNAPIYSKKAGGRPANQRIARGVRALYAQSWAIAPPLGIYSGPISSR